MLTREGNKIFPINCITRQSMPERTLCRTCTHASDLCKSFKKKGYLDDGYQVWNTCTGYVELLDLTDEAA